jgi:hypothetical protein
MRVKSLALATTALVAFGAAATAVQAREAAPKYAVDVYINVFHTWADDDETVAAIEASTGGLDGRTTVNVPFSESGALQVDLFGTTELGADYDDTDSEETLTEGFGFVGEFNFRDGDGLLGGFMGGGSLGVLDNPSVMFYLAGAEGQWWCDNWTFGVQLGVADGDSDEAVASEAVFVNGEIRHYLSKSLRLRLNGGYLNGSLEGGEAEGQDVDVWWWGARGDWWVGKSIPTSLFAAVEGVYSDADEGGESGGEFEEVTLKVGVALHFGVEDQMDNDRNGKANIHMDYIRLLHAGGPALEN